MMDIDRYKKIRDSIPFFTTQVNTQFSLYKEPRNNII